MDAKGVSRHGFALNVAPQMEYFEGIVACGIAGYPLTSLEDLLPNPPDMQTVKNIFQKTFCETFGFDAKQQTIV